MDYFGNCEDEKQAEKSNREFHLITKLILI